ncbi:hypothetical protein COCMIDRAFT_98026 [Bipolaris oryzae ATCC 44560]|uniref:Uncharacterized protein n=1 Tax=Bipolaris oryzae ATCC 44560 TaxID=930090 RepID=W6ZAB9_COCMI|nr:uncharacterized protein COCMIDRAFT_98026 [Bipolaris oryzae ATCC 44560]EUC44474.1 hypothetical protein COCMIDRAFT_98026 [Bipolaris oryzae ATCC 44560]
MYLSGYSVVAYHPARVLNTFPNIVNAIKEWLSLWWLQTDMATSVIPFPLLHQTVSSAA